MSGLWNGRRPVAETEHVATAPFIDIVEEELSPGQAITDDAELIDYMKATTQSNFHPVGTCRMGRAEDLSVPKTSSELMP
jgi:choline dehydrogenase-like flavoprotein